MALTTSWGQMYLQVVSQSQLTPSISTSIDGKEDKKEETTRY